MAHNLAKCLKNFLSRVEILLPSIFRQQPPPFALALVDVNNHYGSSPHPHQSFKECLKDIFGDGILWAVPKHRRTVEKRLKRKFGIPEFNWKPLRLKAHLRNCNQCGNDYEAGCLCPHCYDKVRQETKQMQDKIQEELGLNPIEQDVIVLYQGERKNQQPEVLNGKRIIEMPKARPMWFSKNLLQKTTQEPSKSKEVKPNDLA